MRVTIIGGYDATDELAGMAAGLCYASGNPERSLRGALSGGHLSVTEHVPFTFLIEGISRACLAQLTRHRIASYSVQSQRYISLQDGFEYVTPPSIRMLGSGAVEDYKRQMQLMHDWYCQWQERLEKAGYHGESANQDARFVLPNSCCTSLVMTMNARELRHFFSLRCCNRAQWEIRELAWEMLRLCKERAPMIFRDAGPGCVRGKCPEGKRSCGEPYGREGDVHDQTTLREKLPGEDGGV